MLSLPFSSHDDEKSAFLCVRIHAQAFGECGEQLIAQSGGIEWVSVDRHVRRWRRTASLQPPPHCKPTERVSAQKNARSHRQYTKAHALTPPVSRPLITSLHPMRSGCAMALCFKSIAFRNGAMKGSTVCKNVNKTTAHRSPLRWIFEPYNGYF